MTKNDKTMTKINNQQPSEFAGKIFITINHVRPIFNMAKFPVAVLLPSWVFPSSRSSNIAPEAM
jgi:hypothetical protein